MSRFCILLVFTCCCSSLAGQDPLNNPQDSAIYWANFDSIFWTLNDPWSEPVFWWQAGEVEYLVVLTLDSLGRVSQIQTFAFGGKKVFVPIAEEAFQRFVGMQLKTAEEITLKSTYLLPVKLTSRRANWEEVMATGMWGFIKPIAQSTEIGLFPIFSMNSGPPIICSFGRKKVVPPWIKEVVVSKPRGQPLTAEQIRNLPTRSIKD
ncbi:MAG: hypothetical protein AAF597_16670 [Bacteroidota bacterium]